jgi:phosphoribosylformimino-5-aminoimidazole carboxamide ribonucleotide (ProFAR) isomerase
VAVPLQVAGGIDGPEQVRIAFAAGATRVVMPQAVADQPEVLREALAVAGDWLAVGVDLRAERWGETEPTCYAGALGLALLLVR